MSSSVSLQLTDSVVNKPWEQGRTDQHSTIEYIMYNDEKMEPDSQGTPTTSPTTTVTSSSSTETELEINEITKEVRHYTYIHDRTLRL